MNVIFSKPDIFNSFKEKIYLSYFRKVEFKFWQISFSLSTQTLRLIFMIWMLLSFAELVL